MHMNGSCSSFTFWQISMAKREWSILVWSVPSVSEGAKMADISLRSNPAVKCLPSAWRMTARTLGRVLMRLKVSLISLKKGMFMALRLLGREMVTLTILPSSSYSNLSTCNDITIKGYYISMQGGKQYQIVKDPSDHSIVIMPKKAHFSLIWLHGLGDTSEGFQDYFQMKASPLFRGARIVLLQAPERAVTINQGGVCNSWYDIKTESEEGTDEEKYSIEEIRESLDIVEKFVQREIEFWKERDAKQDSDQTISKRIFLGGFSQGCAISLCYGLSQRMLGGIIGFSGQLFESFSMKNKDSVPMLVFHGDEDDVIDFRQAKRLYDKYLGGSECFQFRLIPGLFHSVTKHELQATTKWILACLQASTAQK